MDAVDEKEKQESDGVKEIKSNPPVEYTNEEIRNLLGWLRVAKEQDDVQHECKQGVNR